MWGEEGGLEGGEEGRGFEGAQEEDLFGVFLGEGSAG